MKTSTIQNIFRIILGLAMLYAGIAHLTIKRTEFQAQVPTWLTTNITFIDIVVLTSGIIEITLALSILFWVNKRVKIGLALALFYILIFPGNINQYVNDINAFHLDTDKKRLIRLFFQPVLVIWALWCTGALKFLRNKNK